eukprot:7079270-Prymnesium_polylepis.1
MHQHALVSLRLLERNHLRACQPASGEPARCPPLPPPLTIVTVPRWRANVQFSSCALRRCSHTCRRSCARRRRR